jgi:hypothetical protein
MVGQVKLLCEEYWFSVETAERLVNDSTIDLKVRHIDGATGVPYQFF